MVAVGIIHAVFCYCGAHCSPNGEGGVSLVVAGHRDRGGASSGCIFFAKAPSVALVGRNYTWRRSHIQTSDQVHVCISKHV